VGKVSSSAMLIPDVPGVKPRLILQIQNNQAIDLFL
jgi:hypothetical protein